MQQRADLYPAAAKVLYTSEINLTLFFHNSPRVASLIDII